MILTMRGRHYSAAAGDEVLAEVTNNDQLIACVPLPALGPHDVVCVKLVIVIIVVIVCYCCHC